MSYLKNSAPRPHASSNGDSEVYCHSPRTASPRSQRRQHPPHRNLQLLQQHVRLLNIQLRQNSLSRRFMHNDHAIIHGQRAVAGGRLAQRANAPASISSQRPASTSCINCPRIATT